MLVSVHHLSKRYSDQICFQDISFSIEEHDKIGLVGRNGCGKSTLVKVLTQLEEADSGEIIRKNGLRIRYSMQDQFFDESKTIQQIVVDSLKDSKESYEAESILTRLGFTDFSKNAGQLSGGEKKRLSLACALAEPCDLLVLDEPTNHLDPLMIVWLEKFLIRFKGALLMVTHDRYFLERVCTRMMELDLGELFTAQANYSAYLEMKEKRISDRLAQHSKRQSFLRKESEWIKAGVQARSTKSKARIERYEALKAIASFKVLGNVQMNFDSARLGGKTIEARNISCFMAGRNLFSDFSYFVDREDRLGVIGVNGCGKSTLLKILSGILSFDSGTLEFGETVKVGYLMQEVQMDDLSVRVIDYLNCNQIETKDETLSASSMLERFLFPKSMHYLTLAHCSGGERRRLALLKVLMSQPNVLLLDEPTNDLDLDTLGVLEEFLDEFKGAVIVISHDRYFLDKVCDHVLIFQDGTITERLGSFSENMELIAPSTEKKDKSTVQAAKPKSKGLTYMEKKELAELGNQLYKLEEKISLIESQLNECSDYLIIKQLSEALESARLQLENSEMRWLELSEKAQQ